MNNVISLQEKPCPCGNDKNYDSCCGQYLSGTSLPSTPEELMRSRYTAYTLANIDYIFGTMRDQALKDADKNECLKWAKMSKWLGLEVISSSSSDDDTEGEVLFIAKFKQNGTAHNLKEHAKFKKYKNKWYYIDSIVQNGSSPDNKEQPKKPAQTQAVSNKVGRNDACICGSGKKYKKCCLT